MNETMLLAVATAAPVRQNLGSQNSGKRERWMPRENLNPDVLVLPKMPLIGIIGLNPLMNRLKRIGVEVVHRITQIIDR
jgi:hypothetical protein